MKRQARLLTVSIALASIAACRTGELTGPPDLRLGRDECAGCGMIISDGRCASAMLIQRGPRREQIAFDDIGCMLRFDAESTGEPDLRILSRFARDYQTQAWLQVEEAHFLDAGAGRIPTPMGSGIVAFSAREAAVRTRDASGGEIVDYPGLAARHAAPPSR